jgi:hypothetical protein
MAGLQLPLVITLIDDQGVVGAACNVLDLELHAIVLRTGEWSYPLPLHRISAMRRVDTRILIEFTDPESRAARRDARIFVEPSGPTVLMREQRAHELFQMLREARATSIRERFLAMEERKGFLHSETPYAVTREEEALREAEGLVDDTPSSSSVEFVAPEPRLAWAPPEGPTGRPVLSPETRRLTFDGGETGPLGGGGGAEVPDASPTADLAAHRPAVFGGTTADLVSSHGPADFAAPPDPPSPGELAGGVAPRGVPGLPPSETGRLREARTARHGRDETDPIEVAKRIRQARQEARGVPLLYVVVAVVLLLVLGLLSWRNFRGGAAPRPTRSPLGVRSPVTSRSP